MHRLAWLLAAAVASVRVENALAAPATTWFEHRPPAPPVSPTTWGRGHEVWDGTQNVPGEAPEAWGFGNRPPMPPLVPRYAPPSPPRVPPPSPLPPPSPMGDSEVFCDASFNVTLEFVLPTTVNDVCATTREAATPPALMDDGVLCPEESRGMRLFYQFKGMRWVRFADTDVVGGQAHTTPDLTQGFRSGFLSSWDERTFDGYTGITIVDLCSDTVLSLRTGGELTGGPGPQTYKAYHFLFPEQSFLIDVTLIDPNDIPDWLVIEDAVEQLRPDGVGQTAEDLNEVTQAYGNDLLNATGKRVPVPANMMERCTPNYAPVPMHGPTDGCDSFGFSSQKANLAAALKNGGTARPSYRVHTSKGTVLMSHEQGMTTDDQVLAPVVGDALADFTGDGEYNAVIVSGAAVPNRVYVKHSSYKSYEVGQKYLPLGGAGNVHHSSGLATYAFEDTDGDGRLESPRRLPHELGDVRRAAVVTNLDAQDEVYLNGDASAPAHLLGDAGSPTVTVQVGLLDPVGQPLVATILLFKRDVNAHELYAVTNSVLDPTATALPAVPAAASGSRRRLSEDAGEVVDASLIDATTDGLPDLFVVTKGGAGFGWFYRNVGGGAFATPTAIAPAMPRLSLAGQTRLLATVRAVDVVPPHYKLYGWNPRAQLPWNETRTVPPEMQSMFHSDGTTDEVADVFIPTRIGTAVVIHGSGTTGNPSFGGSAVVELINAEMSVLESNVQSTVEIPYEDKRAPIDQNLAGRSGSFGYVELMDMDGDGHLDILNGVYVLWNDGHGGFSATRGNRWGAPMHVGLPPVFGFTHLHGASKVPEIIGFGGGSWHKPFSKWITHDARIDLTDEGLIHRKVSGFNSYAPECERCNQYVYYQYNLYPEGVANADMSTAWSDGARRTRLAGPYGEFKVIPPTRKFEISEMYAKMQSSGFIMADGWMSGHMAIINPLDATVTVPACNSAGPWLSGPVVFMGVRDGVPIADVFMKECRGRGTDENSGGYLDPEFLMAAPYGRPYDRSVNTLNVPEVKRGRTTMMMSKSITGREKGIRAGALQGLCDLPNSYLTLSSWDVWPNRYEYTGADHAGWDYPDGRFWIDEDVFVAHAGELYVYFGSDADDFNRRILATGCAQMAGEGNQWHPAGIIKYPRFHITHFGFANILGHSRGNLYNADGSFSEQSIRDPDGFSVISLDLVLVGPDGLRVILASSEVHENFLHDGHSFGTPNDYHTRQHDPTQAYAIDEYADGRQPTALEIFDMVRKRTRPSLEPA